ncbi:MAG: biotin/lipoyl-containing protein, partial [Actinomycetes bacterium]
MAVSVTMPALGESVTEGTVTRWLKQEGDHVEADEPLLEVSTDKVDTEIPSPASGVLTRITAAVDETIPVGAELAVISDSTPTPTPTPTPVAAVTPTPVAAPAAEAAVRTSVSVTMPTLGESVTEGTVTRWLKQEGDHVEADEPLLEVST